MTDALTPAGDPECAKVIAIVSSIPLAVDIGRYELAAAAFAPEIVIDYTSLWGGEPQRTTPAALMDAWRGLVPGFDATRHELRDVEARVDGETATATALVDGRHWIDDALWRPIGLYRWTLRRIEDGWRSHGHDLCHDAGNRRPRPCRRGGRTGERAMTMAGEVVRRVALVTGANRGIGLEVCRQLGARGWRVFLGARDYDKGDAAARRLGGDVSPVALNVDDPDAPFRLAAAIGPVDVLINNAGVHYDTWETALKADWRIVREAFETNLFGAWRMAQAFAPEMSARGWGRIVNVSSGAGSLATMAAGTPAYATSKAALNALTRVLAGRTHGKRGAGQRRLSRLGRDRHGWNRRTAGRRGRGERAVGGRSVRRRADRRLFSRRAAGRMVKEEGRRRRPEGAFRAPSLERTLRGQRLPIWTYWRNGAPV